VNSAELELILMGQSQERTREPTEPTPCVGIVRSTAMWWICAQQFFRAAGYMFFASWFATYLQETRDVPIRESGLLTTMPLLAVVVGSLVGGVISDWILARTGNRRLARQGVATTALVACALLIFAAYFVKDALLAVSVISAGSFCFAVSSPTAYAITIDMGGKHVATVFSTMNMSGNIGGMIFPYVVPWFREATGSWESVLLLFGGMFVAAAVCWLFLNPQGTIFDHSMIPARREPRDDDTR
jgi:nitrate/nitrite transporter NarK